MSEYLNKVFTDLKISLDTKIITLKTDYKEKKGDSPIITYAFYFLNGNRIDISLCSKFNITVQLTAQNAGIVKLAQNFYEEYGINLYDINDPFFNDFCMPFTSEEEKIFLLKKDLKNIIKIIHYVKMDVILKVLIIIIILQKIYMNVVLKLIFYLII
jgi:hypothetical protein